jgi:hypothetical protein
MQYIVLPLLATLGVACLTVLARRVLAGVGAARAAVWALSAQIVVTGSAWLVVELLPDDPNILVSAGPCPDLNGLGGGLLIGIAVVAVVLGGVVLATTLLAARDGVARSRVFAFGPAALLLPYAALVPLVGAALCGMG